MINVIKYNKIFLTIYRDLFETRARYENFESNTEVLSNNLLEDFTIFSFLLQNLDFCSFLYTFKSAFEYQFCSLS